MSLWYTAVATPKPLSWFMHVDALAVSLACPNAGRSNAISKAMIGNHPSNAMESENRSHRRRRRIHVLGKRTSFNAGDVLFEVFEVGRSHDRGVHIRVVQ